MIEIEAGDTVFHRPSRETWTVLSVDDNWPEPYLKWCGWPPGCAKVSDCLLVDKDCLRVTLEEDDLYQAMNDLAP